MKLDKWYNRKSVDCKKLLEYMENKFCDYKVKCELDFVNLKSEVEEKALEDWVDPFLTINMDEVSNCLQFFVLNKSKSFIKSFIKKENN